MDCVKIKNWEHYQSYKDRKPPWIRLHRSLIDNPDFQKMSADSRALLPMLWLLACEDKDPVSGMIRMSCDDIAWRLRINASVIKKSIAEVQAAGFIECIETVTDPLRDSNSTVPPETETEREKSIDRFDIFWGAYPKKVGKGQAVKSYKSALKKTDHDTIMLGLKEYLNFIKGKDPAFIAHPSTWLNGERWGDELEQKKTGVKF